MAQAAELLTPARASETKLVAGVCFAHLVSHYYILILAPLFAFIRTDFGVTYTELSLALTTFNVVSAVLQTPVGFFIDRTGARINLIGGLLLGSAAIAIAGTVHSFWVFIAMFAVLGLANTVYHPAGDAAVPAERGGMARRLSLLGAARRGRGSDPGGARRSAGRASGTSVEATWRRGDECSRRRLAVSAVAPDPAQPALLRRPVDGRRRPQPISGGGAWRALRNAAGARQYCAHRASDHERHRSLARRSARGPHRTAQPRGVRGVSSDGRRQHAHR